jgi:hypothetical protein
LAGLALLAGCGGSDPVDLGPLASAPLPTYGLGDSYHFNDGSSETVVSVAPDTVHWRGRTGTYITARDVLLPRLAWAEGGASGERRFPLGPVELFPLEAGKGIKFTAVRIVRGAGARQSVTVQEDWRCNVAGAANLTTRVGSFDTWRVECTMRETPPLAGNGMVRRAFYYAPAIGYYVRTEEQVGDQPPRVAELTNFSSSDPVLPDSALRRRSAEIQRVLESELSGTQATWSDARSGTVGSLELRDTRRSERYGWCRDFSEHIRYAGRLYQLHGMGCRDPAKTWQLVMLAPGGTGAD